MCGTSEFLRQSCWGKSGSKTLVSTPSNFKVCELESLIRGQEKNLSIKESALLNRFLFFSFLSKSIFYVEFCSAQVLGSSGFVIAWVIKFLLLLSREAGTRTNCSISSQLVDDGTSTYFYELYIFFQMPEHPFCDSKWFFFQKSNLISFCNFVTWCLFVLCKFLLRRFYIHSQRNMIISSGQDWRKRLLHLWENHWINWRVYKVCVFSVQKFRLFQPVRDIQLWRNCSGVFTTT